MQAIQLLFSLEDCSSITEIFFPISAVVQKLCWLELQATNSCDTKHYPAAVLVLPVLGSTSALLLPASGRLQLPSCCNSGENTHMSCNCLYNPVIKSLNLYCACMRLCLLYKFILSDVHTGEPERQIIFYSSTNNSYVWKWGCICHQLTMGQFEVW